MMKTLGIVSHYFEDKTVVFSIERLIKNPIYIVEHLPIGTKVIVEVDTFILDESKLIYTGYHISKDEDDDLLIKILYDLEEISDLKPNVTDPFIRKDLNNMYVVTIDPKESKDLDDAISICDDRLYIHIADLVSYFSENLDEILKRGNTFYLRNSNVPMIPREYSENLISLLPGSSKRAITLEFDTNTLELLKFYPSSITNNLKMSYEDVDNILNNENLDNMPEQAIKLITDMEIIYQKLDNNSGISTYTSSKSHHMIEKLMILANNSIAKLSPNILYRFHKLPYSNKAGYLQRFIGSQINKFIDVNSEDINESLTLVKQKKTVEYLKNHMMSKALYSTTDTSHWALGLEKYTHFTSPIRRAADVIVHMKLLLPATKLNIESYIECINDTETMQMSIEALLEELDCRRKLAKKIWFNGCVIKITPKEVDYYIPYYKGVHTFHISECSDGEFMTYTKDKSGQLKSDNYHYYLGKCNTLKLESYNYRTGKKVFKIIQDDVSPELL